MSKSRGRSREEVARTNEELMQNVSVIGRHIPIQAHFEVVTSLHASAPFAIRLRPAPDPPADLQPELKAHWPKPEEWMRAPQRETADLFCTLLNKCLVRGVEMGAQAMGAHIMRCQGFDAELAWGPEMEESMQASAKPAGGGLIVP